LLDVKDPQQATVREQLEALKNVGCSLRPQLFIFF